MFVLVVLLGLGTALPDLAPRTLAIDRHPPDLFLLAAVYLALRAQAWRAVPWAILIGAVRDATSLDPLGTHAFVLGLVAFVFCEGRRERGRVDPAARVLLAGAASLLAGWLYLLRVLPYAPDLVSGAAFVDALPTALWTALLGALLFPLLDRYRALDELCGRPRALSA